MLFNEIDNFIEVYNNLVIELVQCFGTLFWDLASSVIKFRPKNSVPKHCIRSITYNYLCDFIDLLCCSVYRAFGVLMWEVLTLGQQPYPARTNLEVLHFVRGGGRLDRPDNCPDDM